MITMDIYFNQGNPINRLILVQVDVYEARGIDQTDYWLCDEGAYYSW
jgi:hypothetical protein